MPSPPRPPPLTLRPSTTLSQSAPPARTTLTSPARSQLAQQFARLLLRVLQAQARHVERTK
jgi:hypothetical protein